jgi:hypothetical protein
MAPDLFSLYALDNITLWLQRWFNDYDSGRANAEPELEAIGFGDLLPDPLPIRHGFLGYTVQQYVSRASGGQIRASAATTRKQKRPMSRGRVGIGSNSGDGEMRVLGRGR